MKMDNGNVKLSQKTFISLALALALASSAFGGGLVYGAMQNDIKIGEVERLEISQELDSIQTKLDNIQATNVKEFRNIEHRLTRLETKIDGNGVAG